MYDEVMPTLVHTMQHDWRSLPEKEDQREGGEESSIDV
jgi:hypothetical protein